MTTLGIKILAVAILSAAVLTGTPAAQSPAPLSAPFRQLTLANGLNVILHQDRSVPTVAVNLWYHVGSANEEAGRTGFAHLFEHLMFEGSKNVANGQFDTLIEETGGNSNGSTQNDRTNYFMEVPSNALEMALFLESDRMGYLLDTMTPELVDVQRAVVMNERRQSYDNAPYGQSWIELSVMLWPEGHPYSWPPIGSMEDLAAASYDDVVRFFRQYYVPNNASLVLAGDIDFDNAATLVEKWFGEIPAGEPVDRISAPLPRRSDVARRTITDRVQLTRLYLGWVTPPGYAPSSAALDVAAALLTDGKNSRLYRRLVYDTEMAQDVFAYQQSYRLGSEFVVGVTARPGVTIEDIQRVIDEELGLLGREAPSSREMACVLNGIEASFYRQMERTAGYSGKANQLNAYHFEGAQPDFFAEDLARYLSLAPGDVSAVVSRWLPSDRRVELVVEPTVEEVPR